MGSVIIWGMGVQVATGRVNLGPVNCGCLSAILGCFIGGGKGSSLSVLERCADKPE